MASVIPPHIAELALKDILENLGLAPIVLTHWKISVEADPMTWGYKVTMSWRNYRLRHHIDKDEMNLSYNSSAALLAAGRHIASQLYVFNAAEDEEHMEALALMARRPTNVMHDQQL